MSVRELFMGGQFIDKNVFFYNKESSQLKRVKSQGPARSCTYFERGLKNVFRSYQLHA